MPRRTRARGPSDVTTQQVVKELAKGEYVYYADYAASQTYTQNAEEQVFVMGSATDRTIIPYMKYAVRVWSATANLCLRAFLLRTESSAAPDISDAAVLEALQREKRILKRWSFVQGTLDRIVPVAGTVFAIGLEEGEYLQLVVVNASATKNDVVQWIETEYRQVTAAG